MSVSISLSTAERNTLLDYYRSPYHQPELRLRAHLVLLLADGHAWATITAVLYCSSRTIARWKGRFEEGRLDALLGLPRGQPPRFAARWATLVVRWVTETTPRAFGFLRSRWCCEVVVLLWWRTYRLDVGRETVRCWLHTADLVWRRPRPVLRKDDPEKAAILARLRHLLHTLPDDETVVFADEVDVNLNPKIGSMWMRRGQQAEVVTPGNNEKCYRAGSLHWRTGKLIATEGPRRNGALFVAHLRDLCYRLRRYRKIHVICDHAKFHDSVLVHPFLAAHAGRLAVPFLPRDAPKCNPLERVWWPWPEAIPRPHRCRRLDELVDLVFAWMLARKPFTIEDSVYHEPAAA